MLYIALLHYPVCNKEGRVVATAIANMDIHDIARTAKTYGAAAFFIVNPVDAQRDLAFRIVDHWRHGYGASFNPSRKEAFELVRIYGGLDEVVAAIESESGCKPRIIATGANFQGRLLTYGALREMLERNDLPYLLIFGTGSGLADDVIRQADERLEPIRGTDGYNHLAVRSAVAVILDRIVDTK
ncbi:MAG: RNA methyltransferase [Smithellaceae bacterium]